MFLKSSEEMSTYDSVLDLHVLVPPLQELVGTLHWSEHAFHNPPQTAS